MQGRKPRAEAYTPKPRKPKANGEEGIRLNRFIANSGICSRREADEYIVQGLVTVNGQVVTELGTKVFQNDEVKFDDKVIMGEEKVYILMNKPKNCKATALFLSSGSHNVYDAASRMYHGFVQGYFGTKDLGVYTAAGNEAESPQMQQRLHDLGRKL